MARNQQFKSNKDHPPAIFPQMLEPGQIESELGVPIPGEILPAAQWARTALKKLPEQRPLDWAALFGRTAPLVLDLGCGNGRFIVSSAVRRPTHDHVGIDILPMVIRYATRRANQRGLHNTRLAVCGAYEFLEQYVAPRTIAEIHLYHPQPYHDLNRAYRRVVTPEFLSLVCRSLVEGGRFFVQTDSSEYWQYILQIAPTMFEFQERTTPWPEDPDGRTRREIVARSQGLSIFRGEGVPREDLRVDDLALLLQQLPQPNFATASWGPSARRKENRRRSGQRR